MVLVSGVSWSHFEAEISADTWNFGDDLNWLSISIGTILFLKQLKISQVKYLAKFFFLGQSLKNDGNIASLDSNRESAWNKKGTSQIIKKNVKIVRTIYHIIRYVFIYNAFTSLSVVMHSWHQTWHSQTMQFAWNYAHAGIYNLCTVHSLHIIMVFADFSLKLLKTNIQRKRNICKEITFTRIDLNKLFDIQMQNYRKSTIFPVFLCRNAQIIPLKSNAIILLLYNDTILWY